MLNLNRPSTGSVQQSRDHGESALNDSPVVERYLKHYDPVKDQEDTRNERLESSKEISNMYYDLATDFYEYGWGHSFHFAVIRPGESREHSLAKYEYSIAMKLELKPGELVLDAGCGIGGPARNIAGFSGATVVGLNFNDYQVHRAKVLTKAENLEHLCSFVKGDYHDMEYSDNRFDKAYAIEATCHSSDLTKVYSEIYRVLKPGGLFVCCEWIMTDKYDKNDAYHRKLKADILEGDGLADIVNAQQANTAARAAGFEIISAVDHAPLSPVPWYTILQSKWTISDIKVTPLGRWMTHFLVAFLETCRIAPKGSLKVHRMLCKGADGVVGGGLAGIFSPMYVMVLRKPHKN